MVRKENIDILVELIGGESVAKELVIEALEKKIHIVTANKALIALHGNDISEISNKQGCDVAFEAVAFPSPEEPGMRLWGSCRRQSRGRLLFGLY